MVWISPVETNIDSVAILAVIGVFYYFLAVLLVIDPEEAMLIGTNPILLKDNLQRRDILKIRQYDSIRINAPVSMFELIPRHQVHEYLASPCSDLPQILNKPCMLHSMAVDGGFEDYDDLLVEVVVVVGQDYLEQLLGLTLDYEFQEPGRFYRN